MAKTRMKKFAIAEPKIQYSELYEQYICIYVDPETEKWTIEKCGTAEKAKEFKDSLAEQVSLPWYLTQ